jgi:hypothetical protein
MKRSRSESNFLRHAAEALAVCQLLEAMLKVYIRTSFAKVREAVKDRLPFRYTGDDYQNSPLDGLLKIFRRLSDHTTLIDRLDALKKERDYLAHRAMMEYLHESKTDSPKRKETMKRLRSLRSEAYTLLDEILVEIRRIEIAAPPTLYDYWSHRNLG